MRRKPETPGRRERKLVQLGAGVLLLLLVISAGWYLTSRRFENWMRLKVIAELQAVTGGRVEMGSLHWSLTRLEIDIHNLTVHGLEPVGETPYAHVDHLVLRLKILALFSGEFGLRTLIAERPVIHIAVNRDGTTNQPRPAVAGQHDARSVQNLFDLGIERAEITGGELIWNDQHLPLDLVADDVVAKLTFVSTALGSGTSRFDGSIKIAKLDSAIKDFRPFSSSLEAEFRLAPHAVELRSLHWQSGDSALSLRGRVADLSALQLDGDYDLLLNLRQVAAITRTPQLRQGTLQFTGQGAFSPRSLSARGKAFLRGAEWNDASMRLSGLMLKSDFSVNPSDLMLSHITGSALGGGLSGEATWHGWRSAWTSSSIKASTATGSAHLDLRAMRVAQIAKAFSSQTLRLEQLPFAGQVSGLADLRWEASLASLETTLALTIAPPAQGIAGTLSVSGEFHGRYQVAGHRLEIASSRIATPSTVATASGTVGFEHSALNLNLKSTSGSELQSLISALNISGVPLELHGPVSFLGVISGRWNAVALNAHVELTDFYSLFSSVQHSNAAKLQVTAKAQPQSQQRMHWDRFSGDVHLDATNIALREGELQRGKSRFDVRFSSTLRRYKLADSDQFSGAIAAHDVPVEDLQNLAGAHYPVNGAVSLDLQFSGTRLDPRAQGSFQILAGSLWGTPFKSLRSQINLEHQELQLNNILLSLNGAKVSGTASYNLDSQGVRFQVAGEKFDLAHIAALNSDRFSVEGEAAFEASGSWILNTPFQDGRVLNLKATLSNLVLNGERQGDLRLEADTHGQELRVKAYSQLQVATLQLDGTVQLRDLWPADITLNVHHLDFDPLLHAYLKGHITGHSSAEGSVRLHGPLRDLKQINLKGEFPQLSAEIENVKLNNQGPIRFSASDGVLQLEEMHIVGEGTNLSAQGSVPLLQQAPANLSANGEINLRILQGYYPGLLSHGSVSVAMKISGTWQQPTVGGEMQISNAGLSLIDLPNGLSEIKGTLVFNQNRLYIRSLTARTGGGDLKLGGFIAFSQGLYFDLAATGTDVRLRYPPGVSAEGSADLRFVGSPSNSTLSGEVIINKFTLTPSFDFASYVASKQSTLASSEGSALNNVHFAVHIATRPELQVQSSLARVSGDGDLNLRGTVARPVLLGRVNISSGDVFFNGAKYHLERGDMLFVNPLAIEPIIDVSATTRVRDYDITLGFHGPLNHLAATYRSDPPLPTADVITLLALGRTRDEQVLNNNPQSASSLTDSAANAVLGQALNYAVSSRVQRLFGASRIKIDPRVGDPGTPYARLTVEQSVSNNVTVTYITNLSQTAQQVVQVEVQLNANLALVGVRDQYGVLGFDFRIRQRKR